MDICNINIFVVPAFKSHVYLLFEEPKGNISSMGQWSREMSRTAGSRKERTRRLRDLVLMLSINDVGIDSTPLVGDGTSSKRYPELSALYRR